MSYYCSVCKIPYPDNMMHACNVPGLSFQTGAVKYDQGKPDLSMISYELVEEVAKVRMFGAKKYSRGGWKSGFKVTRSLAAALRHIFLFLSGQTLDPESGLSHLGHAVCSLEHAIYDMKHRPENDDRDTKDFQPNYSAEVTKQEK